MEPTKRPAAWPVLLGCAALYLAIVFAVPSSFPLIEADTTTYIYFTSSRTAFYPLFLWALFELGLHLGQITVVQALLYAAALTVLLAALLRAGVARSLVVAFTLLLAGNSYFSSFHHTIMTESISFTVFALTTAWLIDYLRSGKVGFLALAGLCSGLLIGIRPGSSCCR